MERSKAVKFLIDLFEGLQESISANGCEIIKRFTGWRLPTEVEVGFHRTKTHYRVMNGCIVKTPTTLVLVGLDYVSTSRPSLTMVEIATTNLEEISQKIQAVSNEKELSDMLPVLYDETLPHLSVRWTSLWSIEFPFIREDREGLVITGTGFFDEWIVESLLTGETHRIKGRRALILPEDFDKKEKLNAILNFLTWKLCHLEASLFEAHEAGVLDSLIVS